MATNQTTQLAQNLQSGANRLSRMFRSNTFAWGVSIGLHVLVFAAFYHVVLREEVGPKRQIIPEARLANPVGRIDRVERTPLKITQEDSPTTDEPQLKMDSPPVAALSIDEAPSLALPGLDEMEPTSPMLSQVTQVAGNVAPVSSFFGQSGNAYRVVYVVDVSASLMIYIDEIINQMRESIQALIPTQRFHIVLARPRHVEELKFRRLVPAISRYKKEAMSFLDTVDRIPKPGKADPIEAMKRAFAIEPELIYFLSDGDYPDIADDLERELNRMNANRNVCITAIGFDPSPVPQALLERIAHQHGGHYRSVEPK